MANTVGKRVCCVDGCPNDTDTRRCPEHERARDKARGTKTQRGYGPEHVRTATRWRNRVRAGHTVTCWRCNQPITNANDLHLGHDDNNRDITRGPEHRACNLTAAGRARHAQPPPG